MDEAQDELGNPLHTEYERDPQWRGTRIPSGKSKSKGGGSFGFDPASLDFEQNIISCEGGDQVTVAKVTARQLSQADAAEHDLPRDRELPPEELAKLQASAEETYKKASIAPEPIGEAQAPVVEAAPEAVQPDVPPSPSDLLGPTEPVEEKPMSTEEQQDVVDGEESAEGQEIKQRAVKSHKPVLVTFKASFGKVTHPFTTLFRDGLCLVLVTDQRQLGSLYTLPDVGEEFMDVTVQVGDKELDCVWAGIQFTMPDVPVTFTVLLVREERSRG